MIILGIESSSAVLSVAVGDDEKILGEVREDTGFKHSHRILGMVDNVLVKCRMKISAVDVFAVSAGPGSFTGLRVGISCVKGFCYALDKQVSAVNSLEVWARSLDLDAGRIAVVLDAKRGSVYAACFEAVNGQIVWKSDPYFGQLTGFIESLEDGFVFAGDRAPFLRDMLAERFGGAAVIYDPHEYCPLATHLVDLARKKIEEGAKNDYNKLAPIYMSEPEAEVKWKEKQKR